MFQHGTTKRHREHRTSDHRGPQTPPRHRLNWAAMDALESRLLLTTYSVTTTANSGAGSLRRAINDANGNAGADIIEFHIPGGGLHTIALTSELPSVTDPVFIDGSTNSPTFGTDHTPVVQLDGAGAGAGADGLDLATGSDFSTIKGLIVSNFKGNGILVESNNNQILSNYVGTADGTTATPNKVGVMLEHGAFMEEHGTFNHIGGTNPGDGNLISGNKSYGIYINGDVTTGHGSNVIQGNLIGTDRTGMAALPNKSHGVYILSSANNLIGGTDTGARNIISGNGVNGIDIDLSSSFAVIQGNYIGVNITGTAALANVNDGIFLGATSGDATIGGPTPGAGNVISGNGDTGVLLSPAPTSVVQGNFIGTDLTGNNAVPNKIGVDAICPGCTIGGSDAGDGNIISGNKESGVIVDGLDGVYGSEITVSGNKIGVGANDSAVPNGGSGVVAMKGAHNSLIGGVTAGARNIISGNKGDGILINGDFNLFITGQISQVTQDMTVQGNYIGVDPSGLIAVPNGANGVGVANGTFGNIIGGTAPGAGNLISGNKRSGVVILGAKTTGNFVEGNYIGTDPTGTSAIPNRLGVVLQSATNQNTVGGTDAGAGNLISGNKLNGVVLVGQGVSQNTVSGNRIGTDASGTQALANGAAGVLIKSAANQNTIGGSSDKAGNTIAFNKGAGVVVLTKDTVGETIRNNSIFSNGRLGIDLNGDGVSPNDPTDGDAGPNRLQNFPELSSATTSGAGTTVGGALHSKANTEFTIDFYANAAADPSGFGEGQTPIGSIVVTTDNSGLANFSASGLAAVAAGSFISATATNNNTGDTSEFSKDLSATTVVNGAAPAPASVGSLFANVRVDIGKPLSASDLDLFNSGAGASQ
ncbi:MAG TPA: hypothetical protein VH518_20285 [Tepidisphaeraceae bacterium]